MSYWASNGAITCAENLERLDRKYRFSEFDAEHNEAIPRDLSADARLRNREEFYQFLTCGTLWAILTESEMYTGGWDAIDMDEAILTALLSIKSAAIERMGRKWDAEAKRLEREIIAELRAFGADDPYYVAEIEAMDHVPPLNLAVCR